MEFNYKSFVTSFVTKVIQYICELFCRLSINRHLVATNNNGNEIMDKTIDKTNIDTLFDDIVASTPNVNINAAASMNNDITLSFRNEGGILVQEFGDNTFNAANNVQTSKDQEEVSLNTSKYLFVLMLNFIHHSH